MPAVLRPKFIRLNFMRITCVWALIVCANIWTKAEVHLTSISRLPSKVIQFYDLHPRRWRLWIINIVLSQIKNVCLYWVTRHILTLWNLSIGGELKLRDKLPSFVNDELEDLYAVASCWSFIINSRSELHRVRSVAAYGRSKLIC